MDAWMERVEKAQGSEDNPQISQITRIRKKGIEGRRAELQDDWMDG